MIGYLAYNFSTGLGLKACCISETFSDIAPIIIIMLGIYTIKTDKVHRFLFKDNYQKVMELAHKQSGKDPLLKNYEKYAPIIGWFFLILSIIGLLIRFFDK